MAEKQVSLADLNLTQLQEVKRQLEEETEHLTSSFTSLKQAQAKYKSCADDVRSIKLEAEGKPMLVPLTSSLYVPGRIRDPEHVVVDIGTGYYVKKTRKEAIDLYTSKVEFVQKNLDTLQSTIERKQDNLQSCVGILQMKMQEERAGQASTAGQAA